MSRFVVLLLAALTAGPALAAGEPPARLTPAALAARIDAHVSARIKASGGVAAPLADDAELVRRLHLDLAGRIPEITVARDFIEGPGKDKRAKLIDALLDEERYSVHWANVWRQWLLSETGDQQFNYLAPAFESWLRGQL